VIETLPMLLGERLVLLALPKDDDAEVIDSHTATVRKPGHGPTGSADFDHLWDKRRPLPASRQFFRRPFDA